MIWWGRSSGVIRERNKMLNRFRDHIERIDRELEKALSSRLGLVEDMGSHVLLGNGKRLRPLCFVLSCHICDYQAEDIYELSTIFEYIHAASLLHDDVLDNADIRRSRPSANSAWGNHAAILEGDFFYAKSLSLAVGSNSLTFLDRLAEATTQMVEGQIMEMVHTHNWSMGERDYLDIITSKTASLISTACVCGAIVAKAREETEQALMKFGLNMGIAFQLIDDVLDYVSSEDIFGKPVGKDLIEGKITLPLIHALAGLDEEKRTRFESLFKEGRAKKADYLALMELVRDSGSLDRVTKVAEAYVEKAARSLDIFPDSSGKRGLLDLSRYVIQRKY